MHVESLIYLQLKTGNRNPESKWRSEMKKITTQEKMNAVVKTLTPSGYKMGDKFTLTVGELTATHDTREYYSGRGKKYNSSIKHGHIPAIMTEKELNKAYKPIAAAMRAAKKRAIEQKKYLKMCKNPAFIAEKAAKAVNVIGRRRFENYGLTADQYLNDRSYNADGRGLDGFHAQPDEGYRGCGVYRVGWNNGKMTCTLYHGFHDSCPYGIEQDAWLTAVVAEMKKYSDYIVKMDGSGTEFFFRDMEDADLVTNATEVYYVPSYNGGLHLNIQPAFAEVIAPMQLSNG